uniref:Uncharacterized protein n=1 Tax=Rhizophora mucronata TaxID=61149 RepID=A0A2P2NT04_RHIMU
MVFLQLLLSWHHHRRTIFSEWHPHESQHPLGFLVGIGSGCDASIHSPGLAKCIKP